MFKPIKSFLPMLISGVLGSVVTLGAYSLLEKNKPQTIITEAQQTPSRYTDFKEDRFNVSTDFTFAAEKSTPAVVHIKSTVSNRNGSQGSRQPQADMFRDFFGDDFDQFFGPKGPQSATGSGVIIAADGYIVTNNHVIEQADQIEVTLYDKRSYKAELVGTDPNTDLALLRITEKNLPFISLANSDQTKVGQWVLAVGNPFNLTSTVTAGIISAKGRSINILQRRQGDKNSAPIEAFIQTDAAVNPGNSGGALVNLNGELVGINTAIASNTGSFAGYSFAVPANIVRKVIDDLSKFGSVQRGFLGINIGDVNSTLVKNKSLKVNDGIYVESFSEGSASEEAGMKSGDVIVKIDGVPVGSVPQLQEQVARHRPGDKVRVSVNRQGTEKELLVTLKNNAGRTELLTNTRPEVATRLGADLEDLEELEALDLKVEGVKVARLNAGGRLRQFTDMREGFIITKVDETPVRNTKELTAVLAKKKGDVVLKGRYPNSDKMYYYGLEY
jgi:serine protease Do